MKADTSTIGSSIGAVSCSIGSNAGTSSSAIIVSPGAIIYVASTALAACLSLVSSSSGAGFAASSLSNFLSFCSHKIVHKITYNPSFFIE